MDRRDVIKRLLYPKCKTAIEFKFDTLIVNPLLSYITVQDIAQLNKIATSIKYSSKPKEKYAMIDKILAPRGFKKMASGTNRVVYRFLNDYRVVLKVAIDKVGLSDNGNEYRNQQLLKPFVTKCFEVSPCGTVGLFERVVPITSREEFINISEDVFDLINNIIGKYVLEDIGEKFYMNYGLREGFGPVLLDYPYVFELDGRKLICNVPEPMNPKGYCGGEIDYDVGYNNLICRKCGKRYLATELRKSEENSDNPKIIIKGDNSIMKCVLKRGNEVVAKLNSDDYFTTNTIPSKKEYDRMKGHVTRNNNYKNNNSNYKPNPRTNDDVHFQARLKGNPNHEYDKKARYKEAKSYEGVKTVPVAFDKNDKRDTKPTNDHSQFQVKTPAHNNATQNNQTPKYKEPNFQYDRYVKCYVQGNKMLDFKGNLVGYVANDEDDVVFVQGENILNADGNLIGYRSDGEFIKDLLEVKETIDKLQDKVLAYTYPNEVEIFGMDGNVIGYKEDTSNCDEHGYEYPEDNSNQDQETIGETPYNNENEYSEVANDSTDDSFVGNENYKTTGITSPIEDHYSNAEIKNEEADINDESVEEETSDDIPSEETVDDEEEYTTDDNTQVEIPEVIIHPREDDDQGYSESDYSDDVESDYESDDNDEEPISETDIDEEY